MSSLLEQANSRENREQFLNRLQKASGRKRHQLADHPFKPLNDLPDQLLADKSPEELYAEAVKNSESVNATVVEKNGRGGRRLPPSVSSKEGHSKPALAGS